MMSRITDGCLAVIFVAFALLQLNDPDPVLWVLVYGAMAVLSIMAVFKRHPRGVMIPMAAGYLILSALHVEGMMRWLKSPDRALLFDDVAKMQHPYIEEAREFLGLLICMIVLILYFYRSRRPSTVTPT